MRFGERKYLREILMLGCVALLGGCTVAYTPEKIKVINTNWQSTNAALAIGEVQYFPPSGMGMSQRAFSASGGLLLLFMDVGRDMDVTIAEFGKTEMERALKERTPASSAKKAKCILNGDIYYLKESKMGAVTTVVRYALFSAEKEIYRAKIENKYKPNLMSPDSWEGQLLATGIHTNLYELLESPQFAEVLDRECKV